MYLADAYGRKTARFGLYFGLAMSAVFFLGRDVLGQIYATSGCCRKQSRFHLSVWRFLRLSNSIGRVKALWGEFPLSMLSTAGFSVFCIRVLPVLYPGQLCQLRVWRRLDSQNWRQTVVSFLITPGAIVKAEVNENLFKSIKNRKDELQ